MPQFVQSAQMSASISERKYFAPPLPAGKPTCPELYTERFQQVGFLLHSIDARLAGSREASIFWQQTNYVKRLS
jgi:hypothetical protein